MFPSIVPGHRSVLACLTLIAGIGASAATPTQVIISGPVSPVAGTCVAMQVTAEDSTGTPAAVTSDTSAPLTGRVTGALFTGMRIALPRPLWNGPTFQSGLLFLLDNVVDCLSGPKRSGRIANSCR